MRVARELDRGDAAVTDLEQGRERAGEVELALPEHAVHVLAAPAVVELRLPADLVEGCEFVTTGGLEVPAGTEGSVQFQVLSAAMELGSISVSRKLPPVVSGSTNQLVPPGFRGSGGI